MSQNVTAQRTFVEPVSAVDAAELEALAAWIVAVSGDGPWTFKAGPRGAGKSTWTGDPIQVGQLCVANAH